MHSYMTLIILSPVSGFHEGKTDTEDKHSSPVPFFEEDRVGQIHCRAKESPSHTEVDEDLPGMETT